MQFLVLEDDYSSIKGAFDYLNMKFYNGQIVIHNVRRSQDVNLNSILTYDKIFVDISLQKSSRQDGYAFIKTSLSNYPPQNVVIITGSDNVYERIKENGLADIKVLKKPISFQDIKGVL